MVTSNMTVPSEKSTRYDRQLRLWGDHGQDALERTHVCVINASATGTEILKNLVLPGIGAFTIVDSKFVGPEDLGNNFFLDSDSLGKNRASCTVQLLLELNPEVKGFAVEEDLSSLLSTKPNFFRQFSVVVASQLHGPLLLKLADVLWQHSTPLLMARSYGMVGYLRLCVKEHTVVESHPDNPRDDLRLDKPFQDLQQFADCIELGKLNDTDHRQVPYLVILLKHLKMWQDTHGGEIPKNYKEKKEFKQLVDAARRSVEEENFDEAVRAVNTAIVKTTVPSDVRAIFNDPSCTDLNQESSNFWILVRAVHEFVKNEGCGLLPLRGSIPDMFSSSDKYIGLQRLYQRQARQDADTVGKKVISILSTLGRPTDSIPEQDIQKFCRNCAYLRVIRCRSLSQEYALPSLKTDTLAFNLEDDSNISAYYVLLRAADKFTAATHRFPGLAQEFYDSDIAEMSKLVAVVLTADLQIPSRTIKHDFVVEFCRSGGAELHSVAAFVGGVAGQEVIKLITHQYVPFNNTYLYDAITSSSLTMEL